MGKSRFVKKSFKSRRLFIIIAVLLVDSNSNDSKISLPFHFTEQVYNLNYNLYEQMYYMSGSPDDDAAPGNSLDDNYVRLHTGPHQTLPDLHGKHMWLYDEASAKCLNPYGGFSLCGDVNLFKAHVLEIDYYNPLKYSLILESAVPGSGTDASSHAATKKLCLGRRVSNAGEDSDVLETSIHDCDPQNPHSFRNIGVTWTFEWYGAYSGNGDSSSSSGGGSDWGVLRASGSEVSGDMCASREGSALADVDPSNSSDEHTFSGRNNRSSNSNNSNKYAYLLGCERGAAIRFVPILYAHLRSLEALLDAPSTQPAVDGDGSIGEGDGLSPGLSPPSSSSSSPPLAEEGSWQCPRTRLPFPRNLDNYTGLHRGRQILTGGGLFSRSIFGLTFNVYTVVWYVERDRAKRSPLLLKYIGLSAKALQQSEGFYDAMIEPDNGYGRSILMKLAMPLKKEVVVQGLLEEMHLHPDNARVLYEVSMRYNSTECDKGTEILVSWFPPDSSAAAAEGRRRRRQQQHDSMDARGEGHEDYVEIRIGGELLATVRKEGLGKDFFSQYVSDDPVTPEGRNGFTLGFPPLLGQDVVRSSRYGSGRRRREAAQLTAEQQQQQQPVGSAGEAPGDSLGQELRQLVAYVKARVFSEYILQRHLWRVLTSKSYAPSKKFLHITNSLFNAYRPESVEDVLYSTFIVCYLMLLMVMSVPMPMRRTVKRTVRKTVMKIQEITRSLSNSAIASLGLGGLDDTMHASNASIGLDSGAGLGCKVSMESAADDDDYDDAAFDDFWK